MQVPAADVAIQTTAGLRAMLWGERGFDVPYAVLHPTDLLAGQRGRPSSFRQVGPPWLALSPMGAAGGTLPQARTTLRQRLFNIGFTLALLSAPILLVALRGAPPRATFPQLPPAAPKATPASPSAEVFTQLKQVLHDV